MTSIRSGRSGAVVFVFLAVRHEGKHDVAGRRGGPQNTWVGKSSFKSTRETFSNGSLLFPLSSDTKENMM